MAAAGSAQITEEVYNSVKLIKWAWTSGTGQTVLVDNTTENFYTGKLLFMTSVPGAGGDAPTDNYDITILDKNSIDLLSDNGLNRATATTESILETSLGAVANSKLALNIAAAGSSNTGVCFLWIR
ncbi:MAG: hypothetical protein FVQ80_14535 [Planctomycetes bacterium]|nr:hypothetical protein [Planctomycetota bacterium]